jgi:lysophospholipase L1-like esterase
MSYKVYISVILISSLLISEVYLRLTNTFNTHTENIGQSYSSYYNISLPTWYHTWNPNDSFLLDHSDFKFPYQTNNLGLREKNIEKHKPDSVTRIITMGDSYTEGVGASYDSAWPRILEMNLNCSQRVQVINAGVSGSDPFYDYIFYRDKLRDYNPSLLVASFNSSDFTDFILRGGLERFQQDGTTHYTKGPWFEPLYHYSHLYRALFHYQRPYPYKGIFVTSNELNNYITESIKQYVDVMDSLNRMTATDSSKLIVMVYPVPTEILFENQININTKNAMKALCSQLTGKGITCVNLWDDLQTALKGKEEKDFTYTHDKHYNNYGYSVMGNALIKHLTNKKIVP